MNIIQLRYTPYNFQPNTNSLNRVEHEQLMNDLGKNRIPLMDYIQFAASMYDVDPIYKNIVAKLTKSNEKVLEFVIDQKEMLNYNSSVSNMILKFKNFYEKYANDPKFYEWALENEDLYNDLIAHWNKHFKSSLNEKKIYNQMTLNEIRKAVREVIAEAKEKGLPKSGGKLVHLKKELKQLKAMKESLAQYTINEGAEPVVEFAHLQRFVNEMAKIKAAHSKLAEMLDNQINEVEGKVAAETQKIKEMMGLVQPQAEAKKKKPVKKEPAKEEEPKEEESKEEPKKEKKGKK